MWAVTTHGSASPLKVCETRSSARRIAMTGTILASRKRKQLRDPVTSNCTSRRPQKDKGRKCGAHPCLQGTAGLRFKENAMSGKMRSLPVSRTRSNTRMFAFWCKKDVMFSKALSKTDFSRPLTFVPSSTPPSQGQGKRRMP